MNCNLTTAFACYRHHPAPHCWQASLCHAHGAAKVEATKSGGNATLSSGKMTGHGGVHKWGYPEIIHFNRIFPFKQSILGYPHWWKPPHRNMAMSEDGFLKPSSLCPQIHRLLCPRPLGKPTNSWSGTRHLSCPLKVDRPAPATSRTTDFWVLGSMVTYLATTQSWLAEAEFKPALP